MIACGFDRFIAREPREGGSFPSIDQGITAQILRTIPFRKVQRLAREFHEHVGTVSDDGVMYFSPGGSLELAAAGFGLSPTVRRPSSAWPDKLYAEIAAAYVELVGQKSIYPEIAEQFALTETQARDAVHRARRKLGILTETTKRGVPGGRLTEYGQSLLSEAGEGRTPTEGGN